MYVQGAAGQAGKGREGGEPPDIRQQDTGKQAQERMPEGDRDTRTLLIVDDSPFIRDILRVMLSRGKYRTITAAGASDCMHALQGCIPDLILLDIMMEPVNGWQILRTLRATPQSAGIPVIMITAKPLNPRDVTEYGSAIEDYLVKPITHAELFGAIEGLFTRKSRVDREIREAAETGTSPAMLTEYQDLTRQVFVSQRLAERLEQSLRSGYVAAGERATVTRSIGQIQQEIHRRENRIREIRKKFSPEP